MEYTPQNDIETCLTHNFGGITFDGTKPGCKYLRLWALMWKLLKIFFQYGNAEIYFHICGDIGKDCYDVPMNAENVEVRLTKCGPKVTIW